MPLAKTAVARLLFELQTCVLHIWKWHALAYIFCFMQFSVGRPDKQQNTSQNASFFTSIFTFPQFNICHSVVYSHPLGLKAERIQIT